MAGFTFRTCKAEGGPTIQPFVISAAVAVGDIVKVNPANGQVAPNTTDNGAVVGVVVGPKDYRTSMDALVNGTSEVLVVTDPDAVYAVEDANARKNGAKLDVAGTTGAMTVAADSNHDFIVAATSTAAQETLVRINAAKHYTNDAS